MSEQTLKPSIAFLAKVEAGDVFAYRGYSAKRGGYDGFRGGETVYAKYLAAGYVNPAPTTELGRRGIVTLTDLGRAALAKARGEKP